MTSLERSGSDANADARLERELALLGLETSSTSADRLAYSRDLWPRNIIDLRGGLAAPFPPRFVVWPKNTAEVGRLVRFAFERHIELVPFGAGSGVCGAIAPTRESIVVDMKRMRALTRLDETRLVAEAEAGILGQHLEDRLNERDLTLGHFPSSIYCSTLGGWLAARSAGQCSGRYGKIEDMTLAFTFVDGRGDVHRVERGGQNGDLHSLLIGSEGTLGILTDATVRVAHAPRERTRTSFAFPTTHAGIEAMRRIYRAGLRPAVARLYDAFDSWLFRMKSDKKKGPAKAHAMTPHEAYEPGLSSKALALLLRRTNWLNGLLHSVPDRFYGGALTVFLWEDDPRIGAIEREEVREIARTFGAEELGEAPADLWLKHRHSVGYRQSAMFAMGAFVDTMEVSATWSRLPALYESVRKALAPNVFVMAHFSHAYPDGGSIYFTFAGAAQDDVSSKALYDRTWSEAMKAVLDAGGALSHHHGVGRSKAPMLRREHGGGVETALRLKHELDPRGILNPGALFGALR